MKLFVGFNDSMGFMISDREEAAGQRYSTKRRELPDFSSWVPGKRRLWVPEGMGVLDTHLRQDKESVSGSLPETF